MTNANERQRRTAASRTVRAVENRAVERHYPGADDHTAQLVERLRQRGITDPRAAVRRSSSALIEEAYRESPVGQTPKTFDNNYSPFSNVNVEAAKAEARRRAEEERRAGTMRVQQRTRPAQAAPTVRRTSVPDAERRTNAKRPNAPAMVKPKGGAVRPIRRGGSGQLAESGPREVAFKRVPFPKLAILLVFMCVVLFLMVNGFVRNYEQQRENAALKAQVEEYARQAELLRSELERKIDLDEVKDRAGEIGMIDGGMVDEKYIDLTGGDSIENFEEEDGRESFMTTLSAMRKTLSRFLRGE